MTNGQMNVLLEKLSVIEKQLIRISMIQEQHSKLLTDITNNNISIEQLKLDLKSLDTLVHSLEDEVNP